MQTVSNAYILLLLISRVTCISAYSATLVLGILIAANKIKQTRILGIGFIVTAAASLFSISSMAFSLVVTMLPSISSTVLQRYVGVVLFSKMSIAATFIAMAAELTAAFCICRYVHKNYGRKWVYIPVFVGKAYTFLANFIIAYLLNKRGANVLTGYWINLSRTVNNFITGTVLAVILIIIFYKNRQTEKIIPGTWKIRLAVYIWSVISSAITAFSYLYLTRLFRHTFNTIHGSMFIPPVALYYSTAVLETVGALVGLIFPIYVLVMARKASRRTDVVEAKE